MQPQTAKLPPQPPIPPELQDPPGRRVVGVYICRANGCGKTNVTYEEGAPRKCVNPRCSGIFDRKGQWLKCNLEDGTKEPPLPSQVETIAPPPEEEFVRVGSETRVSNPRMVRDAVDPRSNPTADEYRSEWVAERVAAWADKPTIDMPTDLAMWDVMEALYDEGRKRGHLP